MHNFRRARGLHSNRRCSVKSQLGVSLLELTLVVAILGVVAIVVLPQISATDPAKLDLAAEEIAEAIHFTRTEAMRRGEPIGVRLQPGQKRIRVYSIDTGTSPWTVIYDIYHPVSKKLWDIKLDEHPFAAVDTISGSPVFRGTCDYPSFTNFDAHGVARCGNPETVLLEKSDVTLTLGNHTRVVSLDGFTGKVSIQ